MTAIILNGERQGYNMETAWMILGNWFWRFFWGLPSCCCFFTLVWSLCTHWRSLSTIHLPFLLLTNVYVFVEFIDVMALGTLDNHMTVARGFDTWLFPPYCDLHILFVKCAEKTSRWVNFTTPVRNMSRSYFTTKSKEQNAIFSYKMKLVSKSIRIFFFLDVL